MTRDQKWAEARRMAYEIEIHVQPLFGGSLPAEVARAVREGPDPERERLFALVSKFRVMVCSDPRWSVLAGGVVGFEERPKERHGLRRG